MANWEFLASYCSNPIVLSSYSSYRKDVFETRYADGSRTICNYRAEAFPLGGETVPSMGYVLFGPNGAVKHIESFR